MHGEVNAAFEQRVLDLFGKQTLAADLRERYIGDLVVLIISLRVATPSDCRQAAMYRACQRANCDPRDPMVKLLGIA